MRDEARCIIQPYAFFEIYLDCDYETCRGRDSKGLYAQVEASQISNFCGSDLEFDVPSSPDLSVDTATLSLSESAKKVLNFVETRLDWR